MKVENVKIFRSGHKTRESCPTLYTVPTDVTNVNVNINVNVKVEAPRIADLSGS
jgi:hypothetical protein